MPRENQTLIAIRLDPELLAAIDVKRMAKHLSRSQFIRDAIYEAVRGLVPQDVSYPQDRVGAAKGGRPKKAGLIPLAKVEEDGTAYRTKRAARS